MLSMARSNGSEAESLCHIETEQQTPAHSTRGGSGSVGRGGLGCNSFYKSVGDEGAHIC